ncbi:MAG: hypothetical protein ACM3PC_09020 [Deltaproteobacteria bacterium]
MTASRRYVGPAVVLVCCGFFAVRLFRFIDRYAVNVLFWDQWVYLTALREHRGPWELFSWIHGPHRMGLGYLFIEAVFAASRWDDRAEAFATFGVFLVILALALLLKRRTAGPLHWTDACIPALVLTTAQFEVFIGTPNAAHGPLPLFLVVLSPFLWFVPGGPLRAVLGGVLAVCAAFTGFAILLVPCLSAVFLADALWPAAEGGPRPWDAAGVALCAGALALFLRGYHFSSFVDCFEFPDPRPLGYVPFMGLAVVRPMRLVRLVPIARALAIGGAVFVSVLAAASAVRLSRRRRSPLDRTLFLFSCFTLLFVADAAVGRVCLGPGAALASHYVPYVAPLWLAAYLALAARADAAPIARWAARAFAAAVLGVQVFVHDDVNVIRWYSEGKAAWRACYLAAGDEARCNHEAGFRIYPVDNAPQVLEMLPYLRENRLNLFKRQGDR